MRSARLLLAALGCLVAACNTAYNHYEIRLVPSGNGLRRELACWNVDPKTAGGIQPIFPASELERIEGLYGKRTSAQDSVKASFERVFRDSMPPDVGGMGSVHTLACPFGTVWDYTERFRGETDLAAAADARMRAVERYTNVLAAWFERQGGGEELAQPLVRFARGPFRDDLRSLSWLAALSTAGATRVRVEDAPRSDRVPAKSDFEERFMSFLVERGYLTSDETLMQQFGRGDDLEISAARVLARRLGTRESEPVPAYLSFLAPGSVKASWEEFARSSPLVARIVEARASDLPTPAASPERKREATDLLEDLFADLLGQDYRRRPDEVQVVLECGVEPTRTNGIWNANDGRIVWPKTTIAFGLMLPTFATATWTVPDSEAQGARFGAPVLRGEMLSHYALWYSARTPAQRTAWDAQIAALAPGQGLDAAIEGLTLRGPDGADLAKPARALFRRALDDSRRVGKTK